MENQREKGGINQREIKANFSADGENSRLVGGGGVGGKDLKLRTVRGRGVGGGATGLKYAPMMGFFLS